MNCKHRYWNRICVCGWRDWKQTERKKERGSLQIPLPASPPREDEEREKGKASPEGQSCKERWISPGSRANWLYQPDLFILLKLPGCTNCSVHSHLTSCPNPGSPGAGALTHPSSIYFPHGHTPSSTLHCAFIHLTGITSVFPEHTVIFPKAIPELWKGEMDAVSRYQYQIHQFCAPT